VGAALSALPPGETTGLGRIVALFLAAGLPAPATQLQATGASLSGQHSGFLAGEVNVVWFDQSVLTIPSDSLRLATPLALLILTDFKKARESHRANSEQNLFYT
jgi:hypothetical protein